VPEGRQHRHSWIRSRSSPKPARKEQMPLWTAWTSTHTARQQPTSPPSPPSPPPSPLPPLPLLPPPSPPPQLPPPPPPPPPVTPSSMFPPPPFLWMLPIPRTSQRPPPPPPLTRTIRSTIKLCWLIPGACSASADSPICAATTRRAHSLLKRTVCRPCPRPRTRFQAG
jgi:hypothetical protein